MIASLAPRAEFPALLESVFLDTANDGLVPLTVRTAAAEFWRASAAGNRDYGAERAAAYERARDSVARLLGAPRSTIAVTNSASEASGQVAWALRPQAGANVVLIDADFPTVTYPWLRVASATGVEPRFLLVRDDPESLSIEAVAALVDERTAVVSVSHVQYATGHRLDLAGLARLAHASGALVAVDVAQSAGVVPIDVEVDDVDIIVGHAGKWLCGETGAGFCYLRSTLAETIQPPIAGWRGTVDPWEIDGRQIAWAPDARRLEISSISYLARFVLGSAIDYLLDVGIERILAHDLRLSAFLADGLDVLGATVLTPRSDSERAGIVAARFPGREAAEVVRLLAEVGVRTSARLGAVRFSTHLYNDESDVVRALDALERLLGRQAVSASPVN